MPFIEQPTINREDEIRALSGEFKSFEKTEGKHLIHHCICMQILTKLQQIVESFSCLYTDRQNALQFFQTTMHK